MLLGKNRKGKILMVVLLILVGVLGVYFGLQSRFNGIYELPGYGLSFKFQFGFVTTYETTTDYYCKEKSYNGFLLGNSMISGLGKFEIKKDQDGLIFYDAGSQVQYRLVKQSADFLQNKTQVLSKNQIEKFIMFYQMFKENYAFDDLYGVDLDAKYQTLKDQVSENMPDEALFKVMSDLIADYQDGHVSLSWNETVYTPLNLTPEWISDKDQLKILSELITKVYVPDYQKFKACHIGYGTLSDTIGYIVIQGMGEIAIDKTASTKKAMDQIITEFNQKGIDSVVIDLRFNSGGFDETSLWIAGYFTDQPYLSYQKQIFATADESNVQSIYVKPHNIRFEGNLYVLTSGYTISAAETFLRDLLANPKHRITTIGETSAGFYSDAIERSLPDGFNYTLSNEIYYWFNGEKLEGLGIVPDINLPVSMTSATNGHDDALDYVLNQAGKEPD